MTVATEAPDPEMQAFLQDLMESRAELAERRAAGEDVDNQLAWLDIVAAHALGRGA